jgi:hypothetical protein
MGVMKARKEGHLGWAWWHTPGIPATPEVEVGESPSEASLKQKHETLFLKT